MVKPKSQNFEAKDVVKMALGVLNELDGSTTTSLTNWIRDHFQVSFPEIKDLYTTIETGINQGWITCSEPRYRLVPQMPQNFVFRNVHDREIRAVKEMTMMALGGLNDYRGSTPSAITTWVKTRFKPTKSQVDSIKTTLMAGTSEGWLKQTAEARYWLVPQKSEKQQMKNNLSVVPKIAKTKVPIEKTFVMDKENVPVDKTVSWNVKDTVLLGLKNF